MRNLGRTALAILLVFASAAGCEDDETIAIEASSGGAGGDRSDDDIGGAGLCDNECAALPEAACSATPGCTAAYGTPWFGDATSEPEYAGCASCCGDCAAQAAEICAHPTAMANECWTLLMPPTPDGWEQCSESLSECKD